MEQTDNSQIKPDVLNFDDIAAMVPALAGHRKLVEWAMHAVSMDKVNDLHRHNCGTPGVPFTAGLLKELDITLKIDGEEILDRYPEGAFVTVSNHPFGALDGISLIKIVGERRPDFKVMVNMVLNHISAMRPNFIAVDALASDDPKKKAVSMRGIREALMHVRRGHPLGFFPAGAVSKINNRGSLEDREWQPVIIRLIQQLGVPVIPIFFHGSNSWWFNLLGRISWKLRTVRLPAEVFLKRHKTIHVSIGEPISPEEIKRFGDDNESLGNFLKSKTYELKCR
ncbi:MAG: lysophospholipid acyltransferase family protein [Paramuribaculum sp.]|jgi:putative hemolysin|nr:lysophospholipid acyltransferase family protein [Paramuribaculum sp.]